MAWEPDYAATSEVAAYLRIGDDIDDAQLALATTSASRAVDHATNRQFGQVASAEERQYDGEWSPRHGLYMCRIDDVQDLTGLTVTVSDAAVASSGYRLLPVNAAAKGRPYERIGVTALTQPSVGYGPGYITVDAVWGWSAVPDTIKQATITQAARFYQRRVAVFGVAGSPEVGSEVRLLAKADPDVEVMVRSFRRDWPMI